MNSKLRSYLGLSMRAGKCITGEAPVLNAIRKREAKLVIITTDASDITVKKFTDKCRSYHIPIIQHFTRDELSQSIGKTNRVVAAITDEGFATMIRKAMEKLTEVEGIE